MLCCIIFLLFHLQSTATIKIHNFEYQEKSKLVLFQGKKRFELAGKDCPVGITFAKPERFSCACVTGVWAFYDEFCAPPVKVVGGVEHCFVMPPLWIQQVMIWSNPLRVLDTTLTIFEEYFESYVKLKLYRNTHISVTNASTYVTNNSSWTLLNRDGTKLCLNSRLEDKYPNLRDQSDSLRTTFFCHFSQVNAYIPQVTTFKPGCKGKLREVKPDKCEIFEGPSGEFTCTQPEVVANFDRLELIPSVVPEFRIRTVRTTPVPTLDTIASMEEPEKGLEDSIESRRWISNDGWRRDKKSLEGDSPLKPVDTEISRLTTSPEDKPLILEINTHIFVSTTESPRKFFVDFPENKEEAESENSYEHEQITTTRIEPENANVGETINDVWDEAHEANLEAFLEFSATAPFSSPIVMASLWAYSEERILTLLNLKREDDLDPDIPIQIVQLLNISKAVTQRTCSLIPPEFFDMSLQVFLSVQNKHLQWNPPFVPNYQFQRILNSLQKCLRRAEPFHFPSTSDCNVRKPRSVTLNGTERLLNLNPTFKSDGFEPMIEAIWKIVVKAHSYCFVDFSHFYNDHHQYTTLMATIFTNGIHEIWFRNTLLQTEYNGIAGNISSVLEDMERCIAASRLVSAYPWNLSRPDVRHERQHKRRKRDLRSKKIRVQLPAVLDPIKQIKTGNVLVPKSRDDHHDDMDLPKNFFSPNSEWKSSRLVLKGLGFCLKKFDEPKTMLNQIC